MVNMSKRIISQRAKIGPKSKKFMSIAHHISESIHYLIVVFGAHV